MLHSISFSIKLLAPVLLFVAKDQASSPGMDQVELVLTSVHSLPAMSISQQATFTSLPSMKPQMESTLVVPVWGQLNSS